MDPNQQQTLFNWIVGVLVGLLAWIGKDGRAKLYALEKAQADTAAQVVTRFELQKYIDDVRIEMTRDTDKLHEDSVRMHNENIVALHRIDDAVVRLHQRIEGNGSRKGGHP